MKLYCCKCNSEARYRLNKSYHDYNRIFIYCNECDNYQFFRTDKNTTEEITTQDIMKYIGYETEPKFRISSELYEPEIQRLFKEQKNIEEKLKLLHKLSELYNVTT